MTPPDAPMRLFFRNVELGEVAYEFSDFPWCYGQFSRSPHIDLADPLHPHLHAYIEFSMQCDRIAAIDDYGPAWEAFAMENEVPFRDLFEFDDWYLLEVDRKQPIAIPKFLADGGIAWR